MKKSKSYISVAFSAVVLFCGYIFDLSAEVRNFCLASTILVLQGVDLWGNSTRLKSTFTFKVWSTKWMIGIALGFLLTYFFVKSQMNYWNYFAIAGVIAFTVIYVMQHRFMTYSIENEGIRNLSNGELIAFSTITNVVVDKAEIRIDTTRYRNDLVIKADVLHSPTWDELIDHLPGAHAPGIGSI